MAKSEERLAIEKIIEESNLFVDAYFSEQHNCYHTISFNINEGWITVRFTTLSSMYAFARWLTEYAHIAPEIEKIDETITTCNICQTIYQKYMGCPHVLRPDHITD